MKRVGGGELWETGGKTRSKEGVMSCNRMESRILPYVDGRLNAGEMKEMEAHLKTCAACNCA